MDYSNKLIIELLNYAELILFIYLFLFLIVNTCNAIICIRGKTGVVALIYNSK